MDPSLSTKAVKETDRDEREFKTPDKKFGKRSEISSELDSSIISLISSFKMF
jgi:hypothetical protein